MRKQNVLQRKRLCLYSIQISSSPKTPSYSMWHIFKWKSKAREHDVGRRKRNFSLGGEPFNSKMTIGYVPGPTLDEDMRKMWPLPSRDL